MLAGLFHNDRLILEDNEAQRMSEAVARVSRWYDVPELSERAADHYVFALAAVMIWGTRLMTEINEYRKRRSGEMPAGVVIRPSGPQPAAAQSAPQPDVPAREPPDPRDWRRVDVDGVGPIDIPPVTGAPH